MRKPRSVPELRANFSRVLLMHRKCPNLVGTALHNAGKSPEEFSRIVEVFRTLVPKSCDSNGDLNTEVRVTDHATLICDLKASCLSNFRERLTNRARRCQITSDMRFVIWNT